MPLKNKLAVTSPKTPALTGLQCQKMGKILRLIRHTRNCHELGPHPLRAEAVEAEIALEAFFGGKVPRQIYDAAFAK